MGELIKPIPNYEGYYIGNLGNVYTKKIPGSRGKLGSKLNRMNPMPNSKGYLMVTLRTNGFNKRIGIHRLVALLFIDNPLNHPIINHMDGIKTNNRANNLEWCTYSYNNKHALRLGIINSMPNGLKLDLEKVSKIRSDYGDFLNKNMQEHSISKRTLIKVLHNKIWYDTK